MGDDAPGSTRIELTVTDKSAGGRLDAFLTVALSAWDDRITRGFVQGLIRSGRVTVEGAKAKQSQRVGAGESIVAVIPAEEEALPLAAQEIPLSILYEDEDLIVVDKASGLVVHPAVGNPDGTLVNALLHHCGGKLYNLRGEDRPGVVHRLDKDTSGCIVAAKTETAYLGLIAQFTAREVKKKYIAVTEGIPAEESGHIVTNMGRHPVSRQRMTVLPSPEGRDAITNYRILQRDPGGAWATLCCEILTGRTHQIRVHLKEVLHCPILGDEIYAQIRRQRTKVSRLMLHARSLSFRHPVTGETLRFLAPVPADFAAFLSTTDEAC